MPTEPQGIFISHSHNDEAFCKRLVDKLDKTGTEYWYDRRDRQMPGEELRVYIMQQIILRRYFIVILSEDAFASEWVEFELERACNEYHKDKKRRKIIPVTARQYNPEYFQMQDLTPIKPYWYMIDGIKRIEKETGVPYEEEGRTFDELLEYLGLKSEDISQLREEGKKLFEQGKIKALVDSAQAYLSQKRLVETKALLQHAAHQIIDNYDIYYLYATASEGESALLSYNNALKIAPGAFSALLGQGIIYGQEHDFAAAAQSFYEGLKQQVRYVFDDIRDPQMAFDIINYMLGEGKQSTFPRGVLLCAKGNLLLQLSTSSGTSAASEALALFEEALTLSGTDNAFAWNGKGVALARLQRFPEAIAAFDQALAIDGVYTDAYLNKGDAFYNMQNYSQARQVFETILSYDTNNFGAMSRLNKAGVSENSDTTTTGTQETSPSANAITAEMRPTEQLKQPQENEMQQGISDASTQLSKGDQPATTSTGGPSSTAEAPTLEQLLLTERMERLLGQQSSTERAAEQKYQLGQSLEKKGDLAAALMAYNEALELAPSNARIWRTTGIVLREMHRNDEALAAYDRAIALEPHKPQAYTLKALALTAMQQYAAAMASCDKAIQVDKTFGMAWDTKGEILRKSGDIEGALAAYNQAIAVNPKLAVAYIDKGVTLADTRHFAEAIAAYDQALAIKPDAQAWNNKGIALRSLKRYLEALGAHDQAIALDGTYAYAWNSKGITLRELGKYDDAIATFQQTIKLNPSFEFAYKNLADALRTCGRYQKALAAYEQVIALNPSSSAYTDKGITLRLLHQFDAALTAHDEALRKDRNDPYAWHSRGRTYLAMGKYDLALRNIDEALHRKPENEDFISSKVRVLLKQKRFDDALIVCQQVMQKEPQRPIGFILRARVLRQQKQYDAALAALDQAMALDPHSLGLVNAKAYLYADMQRFDDALATIDLALARDPNDSNILDSKGELLTKAQRAIEAVPYLERALELDAYSGEIWFHKASAVRMLGQYDAALAAIEHALTLEPTRARLWREKASILRLLGRYAEADEAQRGAEQFTEFDAEDEENA